MTKAQRTFRHTILGLEVPNSIDMPENQWQDKAEFEKTAEKLLSLFEEQKKKILGSSSRIIGTR